MYEYLNKLNDEQILPVKDTEGAVLVIAGAGSGKTRVLTSRIAYLIEHNGISPRNILAITFTNKAAAEMKARLENMLGNVDEMWCSTIHSMCVRILRSSIERLGYVTNFSIYDEVDKENVIKRIIKRLNISGDSDENVKSIAKKVNYFISDMKTKGISPDEAKFELRSNETIEKNVVIYAEYEEEMKQSNALDFDDLLLKTCEILERFDEVREYYANKFLYVHVDEFQDVNAIQYKIIKYLACVSHNLFVVGDDDQSIYGWRGAEIKTILNFANDYVGAKTYKLERNYRSTKKILDLANAVIVNNTERHKKQLWTENAEGESVDVYEAENGIQEAFYTAKAILNGVKYGGKNYRDYAVLLRVNSLTRSFEQIMTEYGIPHKVFGGFKFFERKEIKDVLAYLKVLINPFDDESLLRIINVPKRGIGDKSVVTLVDYAKRQGVSVYDALTQIDELELNSGAKERLTEFRKLICGLMICSETKELLEIYDEVLEKTNYMSIFTGEDEEDDSKKMNVGELRNSVIEFVKLNENGKLADYLSSVTLATDSDDADDGNKVIIATIHAVKGLEFKNVFLCGMENSIFPSPRSIDEGRIEEERRLFYVAITRAMEKLYLTRAKERRMNGKDMVITSRSSFLNEIADKVGLKKYEPKPKTYYEYGKNNYSYGGYGKRERTFEESIETPSYSNSSVTFKPNFESSKPKTVVGSGTDYSVYAVGRTVRHNKFGEGTIINLKLNGDNTVVDVAFKGVGIKSLAVKYAPMTLINK